MNPPTSRFLSVLPPAVVLQLALAGGEASARPMFPSTVYEAGLAPRAIVTGNFDGHPFIDIAVVTQGNVLVEEATIYVLLGNGDGTFRRAAKVTLGDTASTLQAADLNLDGFTDLVTGMFGNSDIRVRLSNGDGTFQSAPDVGPPGRPVVADFTSDGKPDLLIIRGTTAPTFDLRPGVGNGTFGPGSGVVSVPSLSPTTVQAADVNVDGRTDIVAWTGSNGARVFLGNGDGTFNPIIGVASGAFNQIHLADMDR